MLRLANLGPPLRGTRLTATELKMISIPCTVPTPAAVNRNLSRTQK